MSLSPLGKVPENPSNKYANDEKAAHFGQYLFFDTGFSANNKVSCATCHEPDKGWGDGLDLSKGVDEVDRHAPTLWNVGYGRWFFWDGRADSLWAQAVGPVEADYEMGSNRLKLLHYIANNAKLKAAYEGVFGTLPDVSDEKRFPKDARPVPDDPGHPHQVAWEQMSKEDQEAANLVFTNVAKAFEAYQRKIVSKEAPFDTFVTGLKGCLDAGSKDGHEDKLKAISEEAIKGMKKFVGSANCIACHNSPNFSDSEFHNIGIGINEDPNRVPADYGRLRGIDAVKQSLFNMMGPFSDITNPDKSPYAAKLRFLQKNDFNAGEFKTPTLRSIDTSAPYMHDGRFKTLKDVLHYYNKLETETDVIGHTEESLRKLNLEENELDEIIAFLKSLTGKALPSSLTTQPASPSK